MLIQLLKEIDFMFELSRFGQIYSFFFLKKYDFKYQYENNEEANITQIETSPDATKVNLNLSAGADHIYASFSIISPFDDKLVRSEGPWFWFDFGPGVNCINL